MGRRDRRNEKRKKVLMSTILVGIMVLSLAGVFIGNSGGGSTTGGLTLDYEGYSFDVIDGFYTTKIDGTQRKFVLHPVDTLGVDISPEALGVLKASPVFVVTFNPNSEDVQSAEIAKFEMEVNLDKTVYSSITEESDVYTYPIVTCDNATPQFPVIFLDVINKTGEVKYYNGCVVISGNGLDVMKATERIIYSLLGVINE